MAEPTTLTAFLLSVFGVFFFVWDRVLRGFRKKELTWRERVFVGMFSASNTERSKLPRVRRH